MAEKITTPEWQRLEKVINHAHMTVNKFAMHIGLKRSENLYQIKKGNHGISKELATTINSLYPRFSIGWLLSGENPPKEELPEKIIRIPVYRMFSIHLGLPNAKVDKSVFLCETLAGNAELAVINTDESLAPKIPVGALVLLRSLNDNLVFGRFYLIATDSFTLIRQIRPTLNPQEYRLTTIDRENFDDLTIPKKKIRNIYTVEKFFSAF